MIHSSRKLALGALVTVAALSLGACAGSAPAPSGTSALPLAQQGPLRLKGVCPDTVVIQTDWTPEAEHGGIYQLLGPNPTVDADHKKVTGTLVASGQNTGVSVEIRAGGPAIGFQTVSAQMYVDQGITLGQVNTDEAVSLSATQPTVAVVAPLDISPQMLMWDPAVHPTWHTIADVGRGNTRVLYYQTATFMQYLIGAGILHQSQVDGSYDGSPANFVASGGSIAQQGFATNEPYLYAKALPQWDKPVAFQLINDTGYPMYSEPLTVRASQVKALTPCLSKLVPIIQKSEVDYLKSPQATNNLIVSLAGKYSLGQTYTASEAQFSTEQQLKLHIAGNQAGTKTLGGFDPARIQRIISILTPILNRQGKQTKAGLTPPDIATSEFVDPNIGLSS